MRRTWPVLLPTIVLALVGANISYNLLLKHEVKTSGLSWFDSTCEAGEDQESTRSCDEVMASKWGMFPPVPQDASPDQQDEPVSVLGLFEMRPRPVALFGMFYFSVLAAWYLAVGRPSRGRRFWHLAPLALNAAGVAGAGFFTYLMFFSELEAWCPWCMVTHVVNGLLLIGAILLWPRRPVAPALQHHVSPPAGPDAPTPEPATAPTGGRPAEPEQRQAEVASAPSLAICAPLAQPAPHPSARLVLVALGGIIAVLAAEGYFYEYAAQFRARAGLQAVFARCNEEIDKVRSHAKTLYSIYEQGDKKDIPIRVDDPTNNPGPDRLSAVIITDFRCPHCARFAEYMREVAEPMLEGKLKMTFKHYPADKLCNKYMPKDRRNMHPKACLASTAAEAARVLGGDQAFARAYDLLFESWGELDEDELFVQLADRLGFDQEQFATIVKSEPVAERIVEDFELAQRVGLRGAIAAEAARTLGGKETFQKARDALLDWPKDLGDDFHDELADRLGLDRERLAATMESQTLKARVAEDVESARKIGVPGARAAKAARLLGASVAFWKAHDLLFDSQKELGRDEFYRELADQLGFDRERFVQTMKSKAVAERILQDVDLAKKIGMRGTPSLYISGRYVPSLAREQDVFWQEVKRRYDYTIKARQRKQAQAPKHRQEHKQPSDTTSEQ